MLVSREVIVNGNLLVITINPALNTFKITNKGGEHEFASGSGPNLIQVKSNAKEALVEHGAVFTDEVRNRVKKEVSQP